MKNVFLSILSILIFSGTVIFGIEVCNEISAEKADIVYAAVHECSGGSVWFSEYDNAGYTGCMLDGLMVFQIKYCTVYGPGYGCMADSCNPPCYIEIPN